MAMIGGGYYGNNTVWGSNTTTTGTTFTTYQPSPVVVSVQPHIVAFPAADLADEPPLTWLRRRVEEVCEEAWAA